MNRMKRFLALMVFAVICWTGTARAGLLPTGDELFGVTMPDIRFALDREADSTEISTEGELVRYSPFTPEDYDAFGCYVGAADMKLGNYSCQNGTMTAELIKEDAIIIFQYNYELKEASVLYPNDVRKEQEKSTSEVTKSILPELKMVFGAAIPSLKNVMSEYSSVKTERVEDHDEICYSEIAIQDYNRINEYLTAIGCTPVGNDVTEGTIHAVLGTENGTFDIRYTLSDKTFIIICPELYHVEDEPVVSNQTGALVLPGVEDSFGAILPRISTVILRYPDQTEIQEDGSFQEIYLHFTEEEYAAFSTYLSEAQCTVGSYYVDDQGALVIPLELNGCGFTFIYDQIGQRGIVTYPGGTIPEPEIAAKVIEKANATPEPVATPKPTQKPTPTPKPTSTPKPTMSTSEYNQYAGIFVGVVKATRKKPDSLEVHYIWVMEYKGDTYIVINFSSMNGFGGYNRETYSFKFEPGHISLSGNSSDYDQYEKHKDDFKLITTLDVDAVMKFVK